MKVISVVVNGCQKHNNRFGLYAIRPMHFGGSWSGLFKCYSWHQKQQHSSNLKCIIATRHPVAGPWMCFWKTSGKVFDTVSTSSVCVCMRLFVYALACFDLCTAASKPSKLGVSNMSALKYCHTTTQTNRNLCTKQFILVSDGCIFCFFVSHFSSPSFAWISSAFSKQFARKINGSEAHS